MPTEPKAKIFNPFGNPNQEMVMQISPESRDDKTEIIEVVKPINNGSSKISNGIPLSLRPKSTKEAYGAKSPSGSDIER